MNTTRITRSVIGLRAAALIALAGTVAAPVAHSQFSFGSSYELKHLRPPPTDVGNGSIGSIFIGVDEFDGSGFSVSSAGDVNGDGIDDFIIAAPFADRDTIQTNAGEAYVVFGTGAKFPAEFNLDSLLPPPLNTGNGSTGFVIKGIGKDAESGFSVSSAGDMNNDGYDDVIIGMPRSSAGLGSNTGRTCVVFGAATFGAEIDLNALGSNGFIINGSNVEDTCGWSVSSAGDVNGDGFDDVIIGAPLADVGGNCVIVPRTGICNAGESYVVFGSATLGSTINLSGSGGFIRINGVDVANQSGFSVSGAGDVNNDGFDDVIIGSPKAQPPGPGLSGTGRAYVVFGSSTFASSDINLSSLNGSNGFRIDGVSAGDRAGEKVSGAGDVNNDGFDDVIVGAPKADVGTTTDAGETYVVFGSGSPFGAQFSLAGLDGSNGFAINGIDASDRSGSSVSSAGDVNGDMIADIIIGAPGADPLKPTSSATTQPRGQSYVIFGRDIPSGAKFNAELDLADLNGFNGFALTGIDLNDQGSSSVSSVGDVSGDGLADVIIGVRLARGPSPAQEASVGESYIIYGQRVTLGNIIDDLNDIRCILEFGGATIGGPSYDVQFDLNSDGVIDAVDETIMMEHLSCLGIFRPGDLNGDYYTDADDIVLFLTYLATLDLRGDANGDGVIDSEDLFFINLNVGGQCI